MYITTVNIDDKYCLKLSLTTFFVLVSVPLALFASRVAASAVAAAAAGIVMLNDLKHLKQHSIMPVEFC